MELHFTWTNGPVDDAIESLIDLAERVHNRDIVREMILTALKAGQENEGKAALRLMNSTLKEMRFTAKVFDPYRRIKKVSVFGSARNRQGDAIYEMAQLFGERLAAAGYMVVSGGGPGIMQAVHEGAGLDHSFGVNIRLPFEQESNPVMEGNARNIVYKYFFNRKVAFLKEADAVTLFPGGFGTLDEAMETLTLLQTGKHNPFPVILLDVQGGTYWTKWLGFIKEALLSQGYIGQCDLALFERLDSVDDAVKSIDRFYRVYRSIRYVGEKLVIRLNIPLNQHVVGEIKAHFQDILVPRGTVSLCEALPEEENEPEIIHLPRLVLDFNRKDFGRLRKLIDFLNDVKPLL